MKVKLLKKVRKRYSIERIDFVSERYMLDNPYTRITYHAQHNEFPIYQLIDNVEYGTYTSNNYNDVYEWLLQSIRRDYTHLMQNKILIKKTKIWYNENKL